MFVPIIIDPCSFYEYRYLWVYLRHMYNCYENKWAIIASGEFAVYKQKRPISNVYDPEFCKAHQYRILSNEEENSVLKFFIDVHFFSDLLNQTRSRFATKLYLLKNRYLPLEREIKKILLQIKKRTKQKIEGIIVWNSTFKSIRVVAKKMGIPIITSEFAIRFPEFYSLSYFCLDEIYSQQEITKQFYRFKNDLKNLKIELFTREELLAIFLNENRFEIIRNKGNEIYEIGIAGCHPLITTFFAKTMYNDLELIEDVRNEYSEDDIIFRKHPGDEPYQAHYTLKNQDTSTYSSEFILKCKRITAIGSNTLLEAMLLGKPIYSSEVSPFTFWGEKSISNKNAQPVSEEVLNFILLVYLAPYNKVCSEEYIQWRLKEKRCDVLFTKHAQYYLKERNIPSEILYMDKKKRIRKIYEYRGV